MLILHLIIVAVLPGAALLRRGRNKPTRHDAFSDLFGALAALYESAARMKPEWQENWRHRDTAMLPQKYGFGNVLAESAARDMRYAIFLLQRYRWKSVVQPLFDEYDEDAWENLVAVASSMSMTLIAIGEDHIDLLYDDERDWIQNAIEQFDDAMRYRTISARTETPMSRVIAEGTYLPVYIAIQLSDRLIERLRYEAGKIS